VKQIHIQPFQGWETWHICQPVLLASASNTDGSSCSALPGLQKWGDTVRRFRSLPLTPPTVTHVQPFQGWQKTECAHKAKFSRRQGRFFGAFPVIHR
jgi:hypothetical protein